MTSLLTLILDNPSNFFGTMILMSWTTVCIVTILKQWQKSPAKILSTLRSRVNEKK